jgi:mono/diheme cytochrome c family protein
MSRIRLGFLVSVLSALLVVILVSCTPPVAPQASVTTEAARYMPQPPYWKETEVDVFPGMNGFTLDPSKPAEKEALRGRIVWNLWVGDSGLMWDWLSQHGFGTADLLKTVDSRRRPTRFAEAGIINQPGFMQATRPDRYGLWIDVPNPNDPDGKFDDYVDYNTYGRSSGVIGLRISDNPNFDKAARDAWMSHVQADGVNHDFYENPKYYNNPKLVRPYVVGMACSLCHVSFDPVRPPNDVNNAKWENLNDYIGAQYFSVTEFFVPRLVTGGTNGVPIHIADPDKSSFIWQLIHTSRPGALDTSFIATDYMNNPGTMNGVFNLGLPHGRLGRAAKAVTTASNPSDPTVEQLTGGALDLKWLEEINKTMLVPRVLKQGDDSVGMEGALSRVYVNIGHAWPQWQQHFRPLVGGPFPKNPGLASQSPVTVKEMQMNSASWNWSEDRSHALAVYFITYAKPLLLKDAPGGDRYLTKDQSVLNRGKQVFAENCAACHSGVQPAADPFDANGGITEAAKSWFRDAVKTREFWDGNFLSDERRHPVTRIGTNATRAAATNAMRNHIWDNFSSETYKQLPKVPAFQVRNPFDASKPFTIDIQGNGPGYYRPPSLVSLWTSAPYLHNNTVGRDPMELTPNDVRVDARMKAFQEGIERMLWMDPNPRGDMVWRTTEKSTINIPMAYLPDELARLVRRHHKEAINTELDALELGPIPEGTPINLISNTSLDPGLGNAWKRVKLAAEVIGVLKRIKKENLDDAQAKALMAEKLVPKFLELNTCPDFYEDKGHEFGKDLPRADKLALIELLKTF